MLILALVLATTLLVMANLSARYGGGWTAGFVICGVCFTFGPGFLPPVGFLFVLLLAVFPYGRHAVKRRQYFPASSLASAVIAFGATTWLAVSSLQNYSHLREEFPYESLESRLPEPPDGRPSPVIPPDTARRLDKFESDLPGWSARTVRLRMLHEGNVQLFVNSPGFGVMRQSNRPSREGLTYGMEQYAVPQPRKVAASAGSLAENAWNPQDGDKVLQGLHEKGVTDFVNPLGFGHFKDRRHVAGFQSHRFTEVPDSTGPWSIQSIDLVGMLLHGKPVVYVSEELPRMDELRKAPTRPLNDFEESGLAKLRRGEDLVVETAPARARMLGSIRAAKQCLDCHGVPRGDLLGAFSYTLR